VSGGGRGGQPQRRGGQRGPRRPDRPDRRVVVGVHPVRELLRAGQRVDRILLDVGRDRTPVVDDLVALARGAGVPVEEVERDRIDDLATGLVHQGVVALAPPFPEARLADVLADVRARGEVPLLIALDGITDPHNVGSIARTAEAVGAHGLIVPTRRAAGVTPTVEKAAAGALAHLPLVRVTNLVRALTDCQKAGCWVVGLDVSAEMDISDCNLLAEPLVLVVGSEGGGLAHLSHVQCDALVRLAMRGRVASLNASVAAAVAMYEVLRHRTGRSS
jgi:23S rRNA (guanosine2251-2'-O)-methyltransferase